MTEQELKQSMKDLVNVWWNQLTNDQKTAVKLLKFSPAVIGSMFFVDGNTASEFAIGDYKDLRQAIAEYGIGREDFSCGIDWREYQAGEQVCRCIEENIANNGLISRLPANLKKQVVDNLRRQEADWDFYWHKNIESLKKARKTMFWSAIAELRKSVEG